MLDILTNEEFGFQEDHTAEYAWLVAPVLAGDRRVGDGVEPEHWGASTIVRLTKTNTQQNLGKPAQL